MMESLLRNARREALFVAVVWFAALVWTVGYCWLTAYPHAQDDWLVRIGLARAAAPGLDRPGATRLLFGVPDWVALGILAPGLACTVVTFFAGLVGVPDDDLGVEEPNP